MARDEEDAIAGIGLRGALNDDLHQVEHRAVERERREGGKAHGDLNNAENA